MRGSSKRRTRKGKLLAQLKPEEGSDVLRSLLARHPKLVAEAEEVARAMLSDVDADAVASNVEQVVLDMDLDELGARTGRTSWGYVEPTEAAWEILGEALDPFLEDMKRLIKLGYEAAATGTCVGIVLGLYRCQGKNSDQVLGWAEDFPAETACHAVAVLMRESRAKQRRTWRLPESVVDQIPEWADMIDRATKRTSRRR